MREAFVGHRLGRELPTALRYLSQGTDTGKRLRAVAHSVFDKFSHVFYSVDHTHVAQKIQESWYR